jgi:hypothetical protein
VNDNPDAAPLPAFLHEYRRGTHSALEPAVPAHRGSDSSYKTEPILPLMKSDAGIHKYRTQPYPGLRSFEDDENDIFFGRKGHITELLRRLEKQQLIVVLGGSGSGKSSVVRAGLIPELREDQKLPGRLGRWYVAEFKPGLRPIEEACQSLWHQVCEDKVLPRPNGPAALARAFSLPPIINCSPERSDYDGLMKDAFDRLLRLNNRVDVDAALWFASDVLDELDLQIYGSLRAGAPSLMLVIDQFEELFRPEVDRTQRDDLFKLIKAVFDGSKNGSSRGFYIVITMRSEELHRCAEFPGLTEIINESMYLIDLIDEVALREAIVKPAHRVFDDWHLEMEDTESAPFNTEFVDWLLRESLALRASLTHKPDQLPLLQHAMRLVWERATARWSLQQEQEAALDLSISFADRPEAQGSLGAGFMRNCLNKAVDHAYDDAKTTYCGTDAGPNKVTDAERLLRSFFVALARRDDRGNWVRRLVEHQAVLADLHDLPYARRGKLSHASVDEERFAQALSIFVDRGYVMIRNEDEDPARRSYEVCHEALIRSWRRYQDWLQEAGEVARALHQVAEGLLAGTKDLVPDRWEYLEPYSWSPRDAWGWLRAIKELRATGVVAINNRKQIEKVFGESAIFGASWVHGELANFLKARDRRDGKEILESEDGRYRTDAEGLLVAIANAQALLPQPSAVSLRGDVSRSVFRSPQFLTNFVVRPENRMFSLVVLLAYLFILASLGFYAQSSATQRAELQAKLAQTQAEVAELSAVHSRYEASMLRAISLVTDQFSSRHIVQAAHDVAQSIKVLKAPDDTKGSLRIFQLATARVDEAARKFFGGPGVIDRMQLSKDIKTNMKPARCITLQPAGDLSVKERESLLVPAEKVGYRGLGWVKVSDQQSSSPRYRWAPVETADQSQVTFERDATLGTTDLSELARINLLGSVRQDKPSISCLSADGAFALLWGQGSTPILMALNWFPILKVSGKSSLSWKVVVAPLPAPLAPSQRTAQKFVDSAIWQAAANAVHTEQSLIQEVTIDPITLFLLGGSDRGNPEIGIQLVRGAQFAYPTNVPSSDIDKLPDIESCRDIVCTISTSYQKQPVDIHIFVTHYDSNLSSATTSFCAPVEHFCSYDIIVATRPDSNGPYPVRLGRVSHISARLKRVGFLNDSELVLFDAAEQTWRFDFGAHGPDLWAKRTLSYRAAAPRLEELSRPCQDMRCYEWK